MTEVIALAEAHTTHTALSARVMTDSLYLGLLDRNADLAGQRYWESQFGQFESSSSFLAWAVSSTTEYHDRYLPVDADSVDLLSVNLKNLAGSIEAF